MVGAKVKAGLRKAQGLRREWARAQREAGEWQRQLQAVTEDQARLRANLREVPQPSPLHWGYQDKLNHQEDDFQGRGGGGAACRTVAQCHSSVTTRVTLRCSRKPFAPPVLRLRPAAASNVTAGRVLRAG